MAGGLPDTALIVARIKKASYEGRGEGRGPGVRTATAVEAERRTPAVTDAGA